MKKILSLLILLLCLCLFGCVEEETDIFENYVYASKEEIDDVEPIYKKVNYPYDFLITHNFNDTLHNLESSDLFTFQLIKISEIKQYYCPYVESSRQCDWYSRDDNFYIYVKWLKFSDISEIPLTIGDYELDAAYAQRDYVIQRDIINNQEIDITIRHYYNVNWIAIRRDEYVDISGYYLSLSYKAYTREYYLNKGGPYRNDCDMKKLVKFGFAYNALLEDDEVFIVLIKDFIENDGGIYEALKYLLDEKYYEYLSNYFIFDDSLNIKGDNYECIRVKIRIDDIKKMFEELKK